MSALCSISDAELVERLPALVQDERHAVIDVLEHLVEMERRRLYLRFDVPSLCRYCVMRLGYSEDAAFKRHRVAKLALRLPRVLDELRAGTMHLTGLSLLSTYLTEENAAEVFGESRGKSRRQLEQLVARRFPRPDVPARIETVSSSRLGTGVSEFARLEPLSPSRLRVEFTARVELYEKVDKARQLLSHALPSGDLGELFEQALDALIDQEMRKRFGAGKPRKARRLKPGSRHVPVAIQRAVWERDNSQCTFVDGEGHRCTERRFLTLEHRTPFALGGPPTLENLCLLCSAHNLDSARQVFGEAHIEAKIRERSEAASARATATPPHAQVQFETVGKVVASLANLGFGEREASAVVRQALNHEPGLDVEHLLRKCLLLLVPKAS